MMEFTIELPDLLGQKLRPFQDRLPEVIEQGLQALLAESQVEFQDEKQIMELLVSQPKPEMCWPFDRLRSCKRRPVTSYS